MSSGWEMAKQERERERAMENYAERRENSGVLVVDDDGPSLHFGGVVASPFFCF